MRHLTADEFGRLFETFEHTAFRLEPRDRYNVAGEQEGLRRWLAGETPDDEEEQRRPWLDKMRAATAAGKRVERVRVVTEPLSDYIRFEMDGTVYNDAAGEDIRYLPRHHPVAAQLPGEDYWLFDSRMFCRLNFDADDQLTSFELIDDPGEVVWRCRWRDAAWHYAIPYHKYRSAGRGSQHGVHQHSAGA